MNLSHRSRSLREGDPEGQRGDKGEGTRIIEEIYQALQSFKYHEMAYHPSGDEYGAVMWTVKCLANPENYERWLKPIIEECKRRGR